jgi:hypothetical protein
MDNEQKAQQEPVEIPEHLRQAEAVAQSPRFVHVQHGRGFGKRQRMRLAGGQLWRERQIEPTSRTQQRSNGALVRATAGHTVWRGVPSWLQQREPSSEAAVWHATKSPLHIRKRRARRKAQLQKASRRRNRA